MIDPLWQLTITLFLSLLFATSAWHKWQDIHHTATSVATYRLVPVAWCYKVAYLIASSEILAIVWLWIYPTLGAVWVIVLLACYAVAIWINLQRGRNNMDCGCGGVPIRLTPLLIVRNGVLILVAITLLFSSELRVLTWVDSLQASLVAVTLLILYYAGEQLLSNHGKHLTNY